MSLQTRLLAAILLAMLIGFSVGAGLAAWQAARTVHDELAASLVNARQSTSAALGNLQAGAAGAADLRRIMEAYDSSRHIQAALLGPGGQVLAVSRPEGAPAPPGWFLRLVAPSLPPVIEAVRGTPGIVALRLQADPASEAGERWTELRARVASFAIFFVLAGALCSLTVTHSLRPLHLLAQGLARVGRGERQAAMPEAGPPEIAALAKAFNVMAAALRAAEAQNRRLSQQVLTIAEEERADIARDLHDEIGPLLFAVTTFSAAIGRQVQTGDLASVPASLQAIQDAAARMQRDVREMLSRLHESAPPPDLADALHDIADFWRSVRAEIEFAETVMLPEAALSAPLRECLARAAQEAISNAVRHGNPSRVEARIAVEHGDVLLTVRDDGAGGPEGPGLGLPGMRARAAALGGSVTVTRGAGWTVTVRVPLETAPAAVPEFAQA
jgi:two-component system sensor histidine kinase UhpB